MDDQNMNIIASSSMDNGSASSPTLVFEDYAENIAAFDIPEEQAREFLQILWDIMVMCADVEMERDPVSLICGLNEKPRLSGPFAASGMVKSEDENSPQNNNEKEAQ
jgi:hypothetical protein